MEKFLRKSVSLGMLSFNHFAVGRKIYQCFLQTDNLQCSSTRILTLNIRNVISFGLDSQLILTMTIQFLFEFRSTRFLSVSLFSDF